MGQPYDTEVPTEFGLGLHHVQLAVPPGSEDECRRFYVDVLGMTEVAKPPALATRGGLWVRADRLEIHLGVEPDFRPARKAHPGILVGDPVARCSGRTCGPFPCTLGMESGTRTSSPKLSRSAPVTRTRSPGTTCGSVAMLT